MVKVWGGGVPGWVKPLDVGRLTQDKNFRFWQNSDLFFWEIHTFFNNMLGPKMGPKEGFFFQQTPGFGVQIPDLTGLEQFHIPKMSNFKSMFLVQNTNSYLFQA
jgi:hypothetical protein